MIAYLHGKTIFKQGTTIIVDVAGVGYEVFVPAPVSEKIALGDETTLFIAHLCRDDGQYLYGFASSAERAWFLALLRVNGLGAKLALLILSGLTGGELRHIIEQKNTAALIRLPGIGKKTAERIVLDLHDRLAQLPVFAAETLAPPARVDAEAGLVALGYSPSEATTLLNTVTAAPENANAGADQLIRLALRLKLKG